MLQWEVQHLRNMMHQGLTEAELADEMGRIRQRVGGLMGHVDKAEKRAEENNADPNDPRDTAIRPYPLTPKTGTSQEKPQLFDRTTASQSPGVNRGVEGQGCAEYPLHDDDDRLAYVGQFNSKGERHGHGILWWRNGNCYEGQWRHDKPSGYGSEVFHDGSFYEGEWYKDGRHGVGVFTTANGTSYAGNWVGGELQGLTLVSRPSSDGTAQQHWSRCISGHVMPDLADTPPDEYHVVLRALDQSLSIVASHVQIARKIVKQVKGEDKIEAAMELQAKLRQRWDREQGEKIRTFYNAAVLLQQAMRGRRARKAAKHLRDERERKKNLLHFEEAAAVIQKRLRGVAGRKKKRERARAVVVMQASFRGMAGRREARGMRAARDFGEENDCGDTTEIEAEMQQEPTVFEKLTGSIEQAEEVRQEVLGQEMTMLDAAFVLQRRARVNQTRKMAEQLELEREQSELHRAAMVIQAGARAKLARDLREKLELQFSMQDAAVLIQKRLRGIRGRFFAQVKKREILQQAVDMEEAATMIQRRMRGVAGRKTARRRSMEHQVEVELERMQASDAACSLQAFLRRWLAVGAYQSERQRMPLYCHASTPKEITRSNSTKSSTKQNPSPPPRKTSEQILDEVREYLAGVAKGKEESRAEITPKPPSAKRQAARRERDKDLTWVKSVRIVEPLVKFSPLLDSEAPPSFRASGRPQPRYRYKIKTIPENAPKKQDERVPSPVVLSLEVASPLLCHALATRCAGLTQEYRRQASVSASASDLKDDSFESVETTSQEHRLRVQQSMKELMLRQEYSWKSQRRNRALKAQQGRQQRKEADKKYVDQADVLLGELSSQIQTRLVLLGAEVDNDTESEMDSEAMSCISRMSQM